MMADEQHERDGASFLGDLSVWWLAVLAVGMGLAPWPAGPVPHLAQKIGMLVDGTLTRPIDIFDLVVHGLPTLLLGLKVWHSRSTQGSADE